MGSIIIVGSNSGKSYYIAEGTITPSIQVNDQSDSIQMLNISTYSITDASNVVLAHHGFRHSRGGPDPINYQTVVGYLSRPGITITLGTGGNVGPTATISPDPGYYAMIPTTSVIQVTGTVASGETITVAIGLKTGSGAIYVGTFSYTSTGIYVVDPHYLGAASSFPSGTQVTQMLVYAASSATVTGAGVIFGVAGVEN
ncbi:MAG: hypothetical protein QXV17_07870 [Candidatus Micrarchaeaceae archaeon]